MNTLATITHKNQLTIPLRFIKGSDLEGVKKVILERRGKEIVLKPFKSKIEELAGSLKKYAIKGKSIDEIIRMEHEAVGKAIVDKYKSKLKRRPGKLIVIKP